MESQETSKNISYESLYPRRYLPIKKKAGDAIVDNNTAEFTFSFMTYNLLGQTLIRRDTYPYCSNNCLKWGTRKQILLREILHLSTDIMCFQVRVNLALF